MSKLKEATSIQLDIDAEFGLDISMFQNSELAWLANRINKFLLTGVETEELTPAEEA